MKIEIEFEEWQVKQLRNYFGRNDKSSFEHLAFSIFDKALNKKPSSITTVVQVCDCIGTRFASETINGLLCNICGNKIEGANGSFKPRNILE